jgi:hypothetical protein
MPRNQSKKSGTISPEKVALYDRCHHRTLIHEVSYDEKGNIIHTIDYRESPPIENNFEYNSDEKLIT